MIKNYNLGARLFFLYLSSFYLVTVSVFGSYLWDVATVGLQCVIVVFSEHTVT